MKKNFFTFSKNLFFDNLYAYGEHKKDNYNTGSSEMCSECNIHISMLEWLPPHEVLVSKKNFGDFIFGTFPGFLVSKRFKELYSDSKFNGIIKFNEVALYYKNEKLLNEYYFPKIEIIHAHVNLEKIDLDDINLCGTCQKGSSILSGINGVEFLEAKDIKQDIFFSSSIGQSQVFISEKLKDLIELEGLKNAEFINSREFNWSSL